MRTFWAGYGDIFYQLYSRPKNNCVSVGVGALPRNRKNDVGKLIPVGEGKLSFEIVFSRVEDIENLEERLKTAKERLIKMGVE